MKVAITVWEDRISPVFDSSHRLLIAEIENGKAIDREQMTFDPERPSYLTEMLTQLDIMVLICGAVSEIPANMIEAVGIRLIPFISGNAEKVLKCYAKNGAILPGFLMPGCDRGYCGRNRNCRLGIRQEKEIKIMPKKDGTGPRNKGQGAGRKRQGGKKGNREQGKGRGRIAVNGSAKGGGVQRDPKEK